MDNSRSNELLEALGRALAFHQAGELEEAERLYRAVLRTQPRQFDALHLLGVLEAGRGRNDEALRLLDQALSVNAGSPDALNNRANVLSSLKRYDEAVVSCERALALRPDFAEALNNRGNALHDLSRYSEALASYDQALRVRPNYAKALANRANALGDLKRYEEALASCDRALALVPDFAEALNNRAGVLHRMKRCEEALACYEKALTTRPSYAKALANRAGVLRDLKRYDEALASCDRALAIEADSIEALRNRGSVLRALKRYEDALACYDEALAIEPGNAEAQNDHACTLCELKRYEEALASCERALAIRPNYADAFCTRGVVLHELNRHEEALACYERALALEPDLAEALNNRGLTLRTLGRHEEALANLNRALVLEPENVHAHNNLGNVLVKLERYHEAISHYRRAIELDPLQGNARSLYAQLHRRLCDWTNFERDREELLKAVDSGAIRISPFIVTAWTDDPGTQIRAARRYVEDLRWTPLPPIPKRTRRVGAGKLRLAYLSGDFRDHTMAISMAELLELHDRDRFQTFAFSFGPDDGSAMRKRLLGSFDRFVDVHNTSDIDVARQMRALEIDVAVDLNGFTEGGRPAILAHRPSPIQVHYLGYPGTMGAEFIDYIIVDPFVVPADHEAVFTEKLVHLPDCYLASDSTRGIAEPTPTRAECHLPEEGFVFAAFNNSYKITPPVFNVWMRLLTTVPGSVLWVRADNEWMTANLRKEAAAHGIAPNRLVFARRVPLPMHLARHRLADLFLDTLPYNAHSTACDALWAGLPVVTCTGRSFASRVAGSLLHAIGLPELITHSLEDYAALARKLATDPAALAEVRAKLARNRSTSPLFDTDRLRRHIEAAYETMWQRHQRGEPPASFAVEMSHVVPRTTAARIG